MKKILLPILLVVLCSLTLAQTKVEVKAQIRPRLEVDGKDFNSDTDASTFTAMRTRLGVKFTNGNIIGFIQAQDTRIWGTEPSTLSSTSNLDLHQAYVIIKGLGCGKWDVKIGRMEAAYGPQRLVGSVGWHNVGRSFDGAVLKLNGCKFSFDLFGYQEVENMAFGDNTDQYFAGFYGNWAVSKKYKIQPFVLWERAIQKTLSRFTTGLYVKGKAGALSHELEFAYQAGDNNGLDVSAMMAAANFNFTFKGKAKPTLSAGIDYLTGDDNPGDDEYKVFSTLYATNHKYYGFMDYFLNIPTHTMGLGLTDIHGKFSVMPSKKLALKAAFHVFSSTEDYTLNSGSTSNSFGSELDITCVYKYNKNLTVQGGFSFFNPGDIFEETKGKDNAYWAYLMTVVNF
ncbi:MAG: alginate export family protein [Rhodothermaceae bacterium]